jgi:hypothetical protein
MPNDTTDCWCHEFANDASTEVLPSITKKQRMQSHNRSLSGVDIDTGAVGMVGEQKRS